MFVSVWLLYLNLSPVQIKNTVSTEAVLESWHMLRGESRSHKHCFFFFKELQAFHERVVACMCLQSTLDEHKPAQILVQDLSFLAKLKGTVHPKTNMLSSFNRPHVILSGTQEMF